MSSFDRQRALLAALGATFLLYLVAGHAFHPGQRMDEAAMGAGICIVLVTVLALAFVPPPSRPRAAPIAARAFQAASPPTPQLVAPRARPSPALLQRFLA